MAEKYTGEVVTEAPKAPAAARPYTGAILPLATKPAEQAPPPPVGDDSMTGFVTGNINKGIAGLAGLPVDAVTNALNLLIAGGGVATGKTPGLIERPVGGSSWIEDLMKRGGAIGPSAEPTSTGGRYAAAALQMAPSAVVGKPSLRQIPRALAATTSSAIGGEAARDIGGDTWAPVGAMAPGLFSMQHVPAGARATAERTAETFAKSRKMGIPVPPAGLKPDRAQQAVQDAANRDLGQPVGTEFSPKNLQAFRNQRWSDYEQVIKASPLAKGVRFTPTFQKELMDIGNEIMSNREQLPQTFKKVAPVVKLLSEYGYVQLPPNVSGIKIPPRAKPVPPDVAMNAIRKLRSDADANFRSDKPAELAMGHTRKRLANALENMIEENLTATGDQEKMAAFRKARTDIAKSHDYENALGPGNRISAAALAQMKVSGSRPLSGAASELADVGGAFPGAVATPREDETFTKRVSPMAITHPPAVAAHQVPRFYEKWQMTAPGQAMIDPRNRLTPEQERLLRYVIAAKMGNQIQPPPAQ